MLLTLMNVEVRWSNADIMLTHVIPIMGLLGIVNLMTKRNTWQWTWIDYMAGGWMIYWLLRVWIGAEFPCATSFLQLSWMGMLYVSLRLMFAGCDKRWMLALSLCILTCGAIEAVWSVWQIFNHSSRHGTYLLTGNFFNPGPFSAYPMMGLVVGLALLCGKTDLIPSETKPVVTERIRSILKILSCACFMVLPATMSRAAWVGAGIIALWVTRRWYWKWRWLVWGGLATAVIGAFFLKQGSAEGRLIIWSAALTQWWEAPLIGVGYGGFKHSCAEGVASLYQYDPTLFSGYRSAGVTDYSFNALLTILTEQGIIGASLCIGTITLAIIKMHRECPTLMYCILSLLIFSCFSYPFEMLPYRIILVTALAMTTSSSTPSASLGSWGLPLLLGCATVAISFPMRTETEERLQADQDSRLLASTNDAFFLKDLWEMLPQNRDNPKILFSMAKMLEEKERWLDSNALLRMGTEVSADPMFHVIQGNNYHKMNQDSLAEKAYLKAFAILPNRHYPLYKLLGLYQDTQQKEKAKATAMRIIEKVPKVKSPATDEMQQQARMYLNSLTE